jgi:hypothetical protein
MGQDGFTSPPKEGMLRIFSPEKSDGFSRVWTRELGYGHPWLLYIYFFSLRWVPFLTFIDGITGTSLPRLTSILQPTNEVHVRSHIPEDKFPLTPAFAQFFFPPAMFVSRASQLFLPDVPQHFRSFLWFMVPAPRRPSTNNSASYPRTINSWRHNTRLSGQTSCCVVRGSQVRVSTPQAGRHTWRPTWYYSVAKARPCI